MHIKYSQLLSSSLIALTYANHVLASPLNSTSSHIYTHNTVELKPIASFDNSFNLAKLQYLPDFRDSEYGWAGSAVAAGYSRGDCNQMSSLYTTRNCSYPRAVVASSRCAMITGYYRECACLPQFKLSSCIAPKYPSSPSCNGKFETCLCPATVSLSYTNDRCTAYCDGKCITKSCTPTPGETGCKYGSYSVTNNCGGTRSVCYADNCRNRTAVSTPYGCQSYFSDCSSKCQTAYADNCRNRTAATCTYGCKTSFSDCSSKCQTCYTDNCRNRTAVSTPYGCQTAFSDCSSKCQTAYADNCRNRTAVIGSCPNNASCSYFSDCSSKISSWSCNSGYSKSGNSCVKVCVSGGSSSCSGQTSACNSNQVQTSSCKDCSGTTHYSCRAKTCSDGGYVTSCSGGQTSTSVSYAGLTCYKCTTAKVCEKHYGYYHNKPCSDWNGKDCVAEYSSMATSAKCNPLLINGSCSNQCQGRSGNDHATCIGVCLKECDVDSWRSCCEECTGRL